jgi:hypothetical protein
VLAFIATGFSCLKPPDNLFPEPFKSREKTMKYELKAALAFAVVVAIAGLAAVAIAAQSFAGLGRDTVHCQHAAPPRCK